MVVKYSLIIPCFNEEKNIDSLIARSKDMLQDTSFELILVNNGSSDQTLKKIKQNMNNHKNIKTVNILKNIGFGFGVFEGIKKSNGKILGYTHADLQTDPNDFFKAIKIVEREKIDDKNFFIKGLRHGRTLIDIFFTKSMTLVMSIIFSSYLFDINAQPVVFSKSLLNKCHLFPNNFTIDIYLYYLAKKNNFSIHRFKVNFPKRIYGQGNNDTVVKKIRNSFITMFQSLILRYKILIK